MKKTVQIILSVLLSLVNVCLYGQSPFIAQMDNTVNGKKIIYQIRSDGEKYRYDFEDAGTKGIVIVDPEKGQTAILMPDRKFVHYTPVTSGMSLMNDPVQSFLFTKADYEEKPAGTEVVSGYKCNKTEIWDSGRKIFTAWYSDDLGFLLKMINHVSRDTYMEVSDIVPGAIDPEILIIPDDYTEVDERMRPAIPEPPPPDSWNTINESIPVNGEFRRGDRIVIKITETVNYDMNLTNKTDEPAKIVRTSMRDGEELPVNAQGPVSYRTKRLYAGESFSNTYSFTAGNELIIQVFEGVINIEIITENR